MVANNEEHLLHRRREILDAAEKVFDASGYASTTMADVAAAAGVSKGTMYNYFQSKRELFLEVFSEVFEVQQVRLTELIAAVPTAVEKLAAIMEYWAEQFERHQRLGGLILEFWATAAREKSDGEIASWFSQRYAQWRRIIAEIIDGGVQAGEIRPQDSSIAATLLLAFVDGIAVQSILDTGLDVDEGFLAAVKRTVFDAIGGECSSGVPTE